SDVAIGDEIELITVGAGCGQSGHAGALYLDNVRTQLAVTGTSLWITAAGPDSVCLAGGSRVTYTYTFQNNGSDPVTDVIASLGMPATSDGMEMEFLSIGSPTFGGGSCSAPATPNGPALCDIG